MMAAVRRMSKTVEGLLRETGEAWTRLSGYKGADSLQECVVGRLSSPEIRKESTTSKIGQSFLDDAKLLPCAQVNVHMQSAIKLECDLGRIRKSFFQDVEYPSQLTAHGC